MKFFALFFLVLASSASATPTFRSGFYKVRPANGILGAIAHIRVQDVLTENGIRPGLHADFGENGMIRPKTSKNGLVHEWSLGGNSGSITVSVNHDGSLTVSARRKKTTFTYRLKYHGKRAPLDAAHDVKTLAIAHRGFAYFTPYNSQSIYPANTIPALRAALDAGYSGFEFDVRLSKDGKLVMAHDKKLSITTNCGGEVEDKTLVELERCTVWGSTFIPEATAVKAPTHAYMRSAAAVLAEFANDPELQIMVLDVKPDSTSDLAAAYAELIAPYLARPDYLKKILVIAQEERLLSAMKTANPFSRYALEGSTGTEPINQKNDSKYFPEAVGWPRKSHDVVSLNVGLGLYMPPLLGKTYLKQTLTVAARYNYPVIGWTVSEAGELDVIRNYLPELEYLITDAPIERLVRPQLEDYYEDK